jgi:uncharacterized protein
MRFSGSALARHGSSRWAYSVTSSRQPRIPQLRVAFLGYLIFSLYMTIGAMETHKVLFAIFVLIDLLFVGLALSTWDIMHEAMHQLAAYSELFISLLAFYASAASVLNTHLGRVVLPVGAPFGIFKKIKQDNPDDTFL